MNHAYGKLKPIPPRQDELPGSQVFNLVQTVRGNEVEPLDTVRKQLIDHILFTQALSGPGSGPKVLRRSGVVGHTVHERVAATLPRRQRVSDHRPVSVEIEVRAG